MSNDSDIEIKYIKKMNTGITFYVTEDYRIFCEKKGKKEPIYVSNFVIKCTGIDESDKEDNRMCYSYKFKIMSNFYDDEIVYIHEKELHNKKSFVDKIGRTYEIDNFRYFFKFVVEIINKHIEKKGIRGITELEKAGVIKQTKNKQNEKLAKIFLNDLNDLLERDYGTYISNDKNAKLEYDKEFNTNYIGFEYTIKNIDYICIKYDRVKELMIDKMKKREYNEYKRGQIYLGLRSLNCIKYSKDENTYPINKRKFLLIDKEKMDFFTQKNNVDDNVENDVANINNTSNYEVNYNDFDDESSVFDDIDCNDNVFDVFKKKKKKKKKK